MVTRGEAIAAAAGWRSTGRKSIPAQNPDGTSDGSCPFLGADGRCENYQHRPLGCRTHFCAAAGGAYPRVHVIDAIRELEALDEKIGGDGPRPLPDAARDAWGAASRSRKTRPRTRGGHRG